MPLRISPLIPLTPLEYPTLKYPSGIASRLRLLVTSIALLYKVFDELLCVLFHNRMF